MARYTPHQNRSLARRATGMTLLLVPATVMACSSGDGAGPGGTTRPVPVGSAARTSSAASTPNLSATVNPADARSAKAIALDWCRGIPGLPRPTAVRFAPADSGTAPDLPLVAVWLRFARRVMLPPGIRVIKARDEGDPTPPLGQDVYTSDKPFYGRTVMVFVDLAARRVHAMSYMGLSHRP